MAAQDIAMTQLIEAQRQTACATLAAAVIGASERHWSPQQVIELQYDFYHSLFPLAATGAYTAWATKKAERLSKVYGASG